MKFIDRSSELKELESSYALSKNRLFSTIIYGMRRVGKTELVKEFMKNKPSIYFFVYDNKTSKALLGEFEEELKRRKIIDALASIDTWEKFIDVLFDRCRGRVIVFDEFQNFRDIYPAFFSMLQNKNEAPAFVLHAHKGNAFSTGLLERDGCGRILFGVRGHAQILCRHRGLRA
jgi:hypothetical protein